jgi:hypothetical protein
MFMNTLPRLCDTFREEDEESRESQDEDGAPPMKPDQSTLPWIV